MSKIYTDKKVFDMKTMPQDKIIAGLKVSEILKDQ